MHSVVRDSPPPDSQALVVDTEPTPETYTIFTVTNRLRAKPLMVKVQVNKQETPMEIDTGASLLIDWA